MAEAEQTGTTPVAPAASSIEGVAETTGEQETPQAPPLDVAAKLAVIESELAKTRAEADSAKRYVVQLVTQLQQQATEAGEEPAERKTQFREALEADPEAAIDRVFRERMGPLLRESLQKQGVLAREEAARIAQREGWGDEWAAFQPKTDAFMVDVPVDQHANPQTWFDAFQLMMLKSGKLPDYAMAKAKRTLEREQATASEGASPGRIGPKGPPPLTDQERRMAKACGMSEDEWRREKAALEAVPVE